MLSAWGLAFASLTVRCLGIVGGLPVSRAFLLSHFPFVAAVLVAACAGLWVLCEYFFEYSEVGTVARWAEALRGKTVRP